MIHQQTLKGMVGDRWGSVSPKTKIGMGIGGGLGLVGLAFSAKDDHYNTIEALRHGGMAQGIRRSHTDFGSGYRGLPSGLMGVDIDRRILDYRKDVIESGAYADVEEEIAERQKDQLGNLASFTNRDFQKSSQRHMTGLARGQGKLRNVNLSKFDLEVEDADTLILKRRGLFNLFSDPIQIRLAGIDAPETAAHKGDPLAPVRYEQDQPAGEQASDALRELIAQQDNLSLKVGTEKTYGRYVGALVGDDSVLNVDLARMGAVAALPYGKVTKDVVARSAVDRAQSEAQLEGRGIWGMARYQAIDIVQEKVGQPITFNTLSRVDKLAKNLNLGAYSSLVESMGSQQRGLTAREESAAERIGRALRKTHGPRKQSYNTIQGLHPGSEGMGTERIRSMTDFGSPSTIAQTIAKQFGKMKSGKGVVETLGDIYKRAGAKRFTKADDFAEAQLRATGTPEDMIEMMKPRLAKVIEKQGFTSLPEHGLVYAGGKGRTGAGQVASELHEILEISHYKKMKEAGEDVVGRFGSHMSEQVIEDEAFLRYMLGGQSFKQGKRMRVQEGGIKASNRNLRQKQDAAKRATDPKVREQKLYEAEFVQYKQRALQLYKEAPKHAKAFMKQHDIKRVKKFNKISEEAVGVGLRAAKNAKGSSGFSSTQSWN